MTCPSSRIRFTNETIRHRAKIQRRTIGETLFLLVTVPVVVAAQAAEAAAPVPTAIDHFNNDAMVLCERILY